MCTVSLLVHDIDIGEMPVLLDFCAVTCLVGGIARLGVTVGIRRLRWRSKIWRSGNGRVLVLYTSI